MTYRPIAGAGLLAFIALIATPAHARAQTPTRIDFETVPVGARVDTQYLSLGLRVASLAAIDTAPRAHGGRQLLVSLSPPTIAAVVAPGPLVLGFLRPQSFVRLFLTGRARAEARLWGTVRAYDAAGVLLARDGPREVDPRAATVQFTARAPEARISLVQVVVADSTPNGSRPVAAAIDDLEFGVAQPPPPPLPPPPPPPPPPILVPDLHGLTPSAAAARLKSVRLRLIGARDSVTERFPAGTIVAQVPRRGTRVKAGTSVSVAVARAPAPPPPPPPWRWVIPAAVAALLLGAAGARRAWRRLHWRVETPAHTGLESLRLRLTAPREPNLEIRLIPILSRGTQDLREGP